MTLKVGKVVQTEYPHYITYHLVFVEH